MSITWFILFHWMLENFFNFDKCPVLCKRWKKLGGWGWELFKMFILNIIKCLKGKMKRHISSSLTSQAIWSKNTSGWLFNINSGTEGKILNHVLHRCVLLRCDMCVNHLQYTNSLKTPASYVSAHFSSVSVLFFDGSGHHQLQTWWSDLWSGLQKIETEFQWVMAKGRESWLMFKWAKNTDTQHSQYHYKWQSLSRWVLLLVHTMNCLFQECVTLNLLFYIKTTITTQYQFASFLLSWCSLVILQNI